MKYHDTSPRRARTLMEHAALIVTLVSFMTIPSFADDGQDRWLSGQVLTEHGLPLANVPVVLEEFGLRRTVTDSFGRFDFLDVRPGMHEVVINLGVAYHKLGRPDEAEAAVLRAKELSDSGVIRLLLANIYLKWQRPDQVMEQLDAYLEENPKGEARAQVEQLRAKLIGQE